MATHAIRGGQGVVIVYVALRAGGCRVGPRKGKTRGAVVEGRRGPRDGVVAIRAVGRGKRRSRRRVHRIIGGLPGGQVASGVPAIIRLDGQIVIIVNVALGAGRNLSGRCHLVRVRQRETGSAMVEGRVGPTRSVVARGALRDREACGDVIRYAAAQSLGAVPLRQVATRIAAIRGRDLQSVVVIDVTLDTGSGYVPARECEPGDGVIERGHIGPRNGVVALRAICGSKRRSCRRVHWIVGLLPLRQVASGVPAIGRLDLQIVVVVDVALRALQVGVTVAQRKSRGAVIEHHIGPRRGVMAVRTIRQGKYRPGARVRRIVGLLPSRQVAARVSAIAGGNLQMIIVVDMALLAGQVGVPEGQREVDRRRGVIAGEARS